MADYEIVIHLRESIEPTRIPLPGVSEQEAEAERQALVYDLNHARLAEVPRFTVQTQSGYPSDPLLLDPHQVTEVDLVEIPASET